jgi:hypothetical protein
MEEDRCDVDHGGNLVDPTNDQSYESDPEPMFPLLHCGGDQVDTYRFFEAIEFQVFSLGAFAAPPAAAPAALQEVYAFLADRIARAPAI